MLTLLISTKNRTTEPRSYAKVGRRASPMMKSLLALILTISMSSPASHEPRSFWLTVDYVLRISHREKCGDENCEGFFLTVHEKAMKCGLMCVYHAEGESEGMTGRFYPGSDTPEGSEVDVSLDPHSQFSSLYLLQSAQITTPPGIGGCSA